MFYVWFQHQIFDIILDLVCSCVQLVIAVELNDLLGRAGKVMKGQYGFAAIQKVRILSLLDSPKRSMRAQAKRGQVEKPRDGATCGDLADVLPGVMMGCWAVTCHVSRVTRCAVL